MAAKRSASGSRRERPAVRTLKEEHAEATRAAIFKSARLLFARRGFAAVSIDDIARRARVTRGAVYHHFEDKTQLFRAVFESVQTEIAAEVETALEAASPAKQLEAICQTMLDFSLGRDVRRIVLIDGPAVLGLEEWHRAEVSFGPKLFERGLRAAGDADAARPLEPLALVLVGALAETALMVAHSEDQAKARREAGAVVSRVVAGLGSG